ncbi:MAG: histidine kinase dimerization/phosphoacceptor domain -containing protein [Jannaschia helgolandensis]
MAALLSIALLPIGLIAVMQTLSVASKAQVNAELALLALTEQAAVQERLTLRLARGAADALAIVMLELRDQSDICSRIMQDFVARSDRFSYAGFTAVSGESTCNSAGRTVDFSDTATFAKLSANQISTITISRQARISGTSVLLVSTPVFGATNDFSGYVTISIPLSKLVPPGRETVQHSLLNLVMFNDEGDILTSIGEPENVARNLPRNLALTDLVVDDNNASTLEDVEGRRRIYTVATIEPGQVYVLGIWDSSASLARQAEGEILTSLFPALMWFAGLLVALFAVHHLVIRHLQILGRQMALFTAARRLPNEDAGLSPPTEILRIQRAFHRMTDALIRDEASLENAIREKSVLVKEIHHRVKNNLQLISSIINMQIREATSPEAKDALRATQDRVLSMATIHRDLYQTNETGLVDAAHLVQEVVSKTVDITPDFNDLELQINVGDIWLYPDQAVPMSLLASEAVINALKHMAPTDPSGAARLMAVKFTCDTDRNCRFELSNPISDEPDGRRSGHGMGHKLIRAFATQLAADVTTSQADGRYTITVTFTASEFAPAPGTF